MKLATFSNDLLTNYAFKQATKQEHDMKERGLWKVIRYDPGQRLCGESATFQSKGYKICGMVVTTNIACLHS